VSTTAGGRQRECTHNRHRQPIGRAHRTVPLAVDAVHPHTNERIAVEQRSRTYVRTYVQGTNRQHEIYLVCLLLYKYRTICTWYTTVHTKWKRSWWIRRRDNWQERKGFTTSTVQSWPSQRSNILCHATELYIVHRRPKEGQSNTIRESFLRSELSLQENQRWRPSTHCSCLH
jgi:hypothetical protein